MKEFSLQDRTKLRSYSLPVSVALFHYKNCPAKTVATEHHDESGIIASWCYRPDEEGAEWVQ